MFVSKRGGMCGLDTKLIQWHDAWITVSEKAQKDPELEAVSAIQLIDELLAKTT